MRTEISIFSRLTCNRGRHRLPLDAGPSLRGKRRSRLSAGKTHVRSGKPIFPECIFGLCFGEWPLGLGRTVPSWSRQDSDWPIEQVSHMTRRHCTDLASKFLWQLSGVGSGSGILADTTHSMASLFDLRQRGEAPAPNSLGKVGWSSWCASSFTFAAAGF